MALKATIFKAELQVADMDRDYYETHSLTIARHPSENSDRMMIRILVFALRAHERLAFGGGVSTPEEPDLWRKSLSGEIEEWIELGQPDPRRIAKACGRADEVRVYLYGGNKASTWWEQERAGFERHSNLGVYLLPLEQTSELAELAERSMSLQCNVQDGEVWVMSGERTVHVTPMTLMGE